MRVWGGGRREEFFLEKVWGRGRGHEKHLKSRLMKALLLCSIYSNMNLQEGSTLSIQLQVQKTKRIMG